MVLSSIYTRTGDDGTTGLGDFSRTSKTDPRLVAYADCDEAGAALGLALTCASDLPDALRPVLLRIQNDLFDVGADLSTPLCESPKHPPLRVHSEWITELETECDRFGADLPTLRSFVLAGGTTASAYLHLARTVVRRAERAAWDAINTHGTEPAPGDGKDADRPGGVNLATAKYLNRLSDALFVFARYCNAQPSASGSPAVGDVLWQPGGGRGTDEPDADAQPTP